MVKSLFSSIIFLKAVLSQVTRNIVSNEDMALEIISQGFDFCSKLVIYTPETHLTETDIHIKGFENRRAYAQYAKFLKKLLNFRKNLDNNVILNHIDILSQIQNLFYKIETSMIDILSNNAHENLVYLETTRRNIKRPQAPKFELEKLFYFLNQNINFIKNHKLYFGEKLNNYKAERIFLLKQHLKFKNKIRRNLRQVRIRAKFELAFLSIRSSLFDLVHA